MKLLHERLVLRTWKSLIDAPLDMRRRLLVCESEREGLPNAHSKINVATNDLHTPVAFIGGDLKGLCSVRRRVSGHQDGLRVRAKRSDDLRTGVQNTHKLLNG